MWSQVTKPRKEGGLGIKKLSEWSKAAAMKHMWHLLTDGTGSMWSDWVREYLLRGRNLWHATQSGTCSWVWRHLLSLWHLMLPLTAWRMGDGSRISFWKDSWAEGRTITFIVGDRFIKKTGINLDISVREFYFHPIWVISSKEGRIRLGGNAVPSFYASSASFHNRSLSKMIQ